MKRTRLRRLRLWSRVGDRRRGLLQAGPTLIPCALGRSGIGRKRREGDGLSPRGSFGMLGARFRPDRFGARPASGLPLRASQPEDGWCDEAGDRRYNRPVRLPLPGISTERMWREDALYDLVIDLAYNRGPIRPGRGSAIFMHLAKPGYQPTEGCIALRRADLIRLMRQIGPRTRIVIG